MPSLLNKNRPPIYCPGCAHDRVTQALDQAFDRMGIQGHQAVIVSDIGCSGLFDTFFNTHAFHGLHGRALTYATGIKMAAPDQHVVVTMGDGGLGIGGAHLVSTCRRNINLTLLVLNNFNYGMTGGQCSSTTPQDALVGSGFLNAIEKPLDACSLTRSAGASYVRRVSAYDKQLSYEIEKAVAFNGFAVIDIWGVCPGRYTRRNRLTPKLIAERLDQLPPMPGPAPENTREEYGAAYRRKAAEQPAVLAPMTVSKQFEPVHDTTQEVVMLGSAGQRIVTAGEILCLAGLTAGLNVTQKNDYPITVLRGHSVAELVLSPNPIGFTGIRQPDVVLALADEGTLRRKAMLGDLRKGCLVIKDSQVSLPPVDGKVVEIDFAQQGIKAPDRAIASLALLTQYGKGVSLDMLKAALSHRFQGAVLESAYQLVDKSLQIFSQKVS